MISQYTRVFLIAFGLLFVSSLIYPHPNTFATEAQLTIIHSGNINGYLFPCPT
jgi:hypothetical protein